LPKVKGKYREFAHANGVTPPGFWQAHPQKSDAEWPQKLTRTCSGAAFCGQAPKFFCVPAPLSSGAGTYVAVKFLVFHFDLDRTLVG
jgi:hypothetical protein